MVSQASRELWSVMPISIVPSLKNHSSFSSMTFLFIYFPKDTVSYMWWPSTNACPMVLNTGQSENRAKGAVSPSERLSPSAVGFFLLLWYVSVHHSNEGWPFCSSQLGNLLQRSHLLPDRVNQHTPPTPDGSLPLPLLGKNSQTYFCVSRLGHGWMHPRVEALYEHQQKRLTQSKGTGKIWAFPPLCMLFLFTPWFTYLFFFHTKS